MVLARSLVDQQSSWRLSENVAVDIVHSGYSLHPAYASYLESFSTSVLGCPLHLPSALAGALGRGWLLPPFQMFDSQRLISMKNAPSSSHLLKADDKLCKSSVS